MLSPESVTFLKRLLDTPGPSGFETHAARVWRDEASRFASVSSDVVGNSFALIEAKAKAPAKAAAKPDEKQKKLSPKDAPTILLAGHIDEIGLIVTYIDDDGYVYVAAIGGWDPQVLVAQRLRFRGRDGDVIGLVGKKPIHLIKLDEREKAAKLTDLWVDIGARTRAEAEAVLRIGDAAVIDQPAIEMPNQRIASRAIDNRVGAFVVLEALRRYAAKPGSARVIAIASTQEEIGLTGGGILPGATRSRADMAVVVDVTFATDHPGIEKKEHGDHRLGGGPVLTRGSVVSPVAFELLRSTAEQLQMPYTVQAAGRLTSTDADYVAVSRKGVATGLVSVPNRYMHSPNEVVSLEDLDRTAELIAETCRRVTAATDFKAR